MKKKNKQKLSNFWNKVKKPLMILSFIGNVFFLLFIIVGCVGTKKQKTQVNAEDTAIFTLRDTKWKLNNDVITKTPLGYNFIDGTDFNEEGEHYKVFYTIDSVNYDFFYTELSFTHRLITHRHEINHYLYGTYYDEVTEYTDEFYTSTYITNTGEFSYSFNSDFDFIIEFLSNDSEDLWHVATDYENQDLINWFFSNATLISNNSKNILTFVNQINYNAPYIADLNSPFVSHYFEHQTDLGFDLVYDLPWFISNGQMFNRIRLWYWNANGTQYEWNGSVTNIYSGDNCAWFGFMQYINTNTNLTIEVNSRNVVYLSSSYITNSSTWVTQEYRYLLFQSELTPTEVKNVTQFNNSTVGNSFNGVASDVGLGGVFSLFSSAFMSFTNLFAIQLLPGITIGLLFFMPLIVTIIIVIIKLVKR